MKSKIRSTRGLKFLVALLIFLAGAFIMPATAQDSATAEVASAAVETVSPAVVEATVAAPSEASVYRPALTLFCSLSLLPYFSLK